MAQRPNFLIFMVDQLSGTLFPDGPAEFLQVPVLRRLSEHAVRFSNAYCASPLCTPGRISFMSALLPSRTGVYDNAAEFASSIPTFAHYLRCGGYRTILSGKMHFVGADQLHGFEERLTTDIYPADFGWTPDWRSPHERIDGWYHNLGSVTGAGVAATTNQLEFDDEVAYHAKLELYQLARQVDRRPFCLTVSFTHPHDPYVARQRYWDLYDPASLPMPHLPSIPYPGQDPHSRRLYDVCDWRRFDITERNIRDARRGYFANLSYLDQQIGDILDVLGAGGLADDTVIVFCADHGDMLGERGLWFKMSFFEGSMRVPLLIHAPRLLRPRRVAEPVSNLDLLPTLTELAGLDAAQRVDEIDGASLVALAAGGVEPRRRVLAEYAAEGSLAPMVMIREGGYKYVHCERDPAQLFDLSTDPMETANLADAPSHVETVRKFRDFVHARWDLDRFEREVRASQARRLLVYQALRSGRYRSWDYQPVERAAERYMRNHLDLNALEAASRFPREQD